MHNKGRVRLTLSSVLTAVASNGSHVYTVNNHLNSGSPVCWSKLAKYAVCSEYLNDKARKDKLIHRNYHFFCFRSQCVKPVAMTSATALYTSALIAT